MTIGKSRLEAFSDGVIAIIITVMVLNLRIPKTADLNELRDLAPQLLSYAISYVMIGIYWNNHHHLLHAVQKVSGSVLWANLHLLFWLSLIPWLTGWMGETGFASLTVALYGVILFMAGFAYFILTQRLLAIHGKTSTLALALGSKFKERVSIVIYGAAVPLAFPYPRLAYGLYIIVAILWLIPDRRIERAMAAR
jgi:uncharacterized membrane protein